MMDFDFIRELKKHEDTKIILLVMDGLGGLPIQPGGPTELEKARTPNFDDLAKHGLCGLHVPVRPGITPGSGPSHLALFGYDALRYQVGRGVLSALGIDFDLRNSDVAARGNFCSIDENGLVTDRRAGRIPTEKNRELCALLRDIELPGVELFVETVKEHRIVLVLRGEDLEADIADTDPEEVGVKPLEPEALTTESRKTADLVKNFLKQAGTILAGHHPANMLLLRGFAKKPDWPSFEQIYGLRAAAIAGYPMYRGVAKLVGMEALQAVDGVEREFQVVRDRWRDFDFFYVHVKHTDSAGEDGDFERKVSLIEEVDRQIPSLIELDPDVLIVTGDHSTPALLKHHSWHPVPTLLWSKHCRQDNVEQFGERACMLGGLGPRFPATDLLPLAMANALRLEKFGA
jgi:2,3-bisphosphoglycerate-independent phosphoglycerate mutase